MSVPEVQFVKTKKASEKKKALKARLEQQKAVDTALFKVIKKTPNLAAYLRTKFTLEKNTFPHALKF